MGDVLATESLFIQSINADHQAMLHIHSLMDRSVSRANSTPLWGLLDTILDTWLINHVCPNYCSRSNVEDKLTQNVNKQLLLSGII